MILVLSPMKHWLGVQRSTVDCAKWAREPSWNANSAQPGQPTHTIFLLLPLLLLPLLRLLTAAFACSLLNALLPPHSGYRQLYAVYYYCSCLVIITKPSLIVSVMSVCIFYGERIPTSGGWPAHFFTSLIALQRVGSPA